MNVRIELTYKTPKGIESDFYSSEMSADEAMSLVEDFERTGRVKNIRFIDSFETSWTLKELKKYRAEIQTEPHHIVVYFDGGFDRKTKTSGLGCTIYYKQNNKSFRVRKNALLKELQTNNEAEYAALYLAIQELEQLHVRDLPVTFIGDSQVVINHLKGEWPCLEEELAKWIDWIERRLRQSGIYPNFELVSRKGNQEADKLASQALKEIEITSTIQT
ncbi:reverse transcriptase-like protein [Salibacterium salarium]|uniref:Reverse transcriptase-like protein n=1 Tax=Salibacterium salarium TaxID=284579 RepID=A0A3R9Q5R2_9BACI|nr:reverse transcriptase-like protein [Salibacterium salarium]RSL34182.1 reverse transcriptase-like protein [Salibacterium salarium]